MKSGKFQIPPTFSDVARDFVSKLLVLEPANRLSIQTMKTHPFFRLGLPADYVIPRPLPIPSMQTPIDPAMIQGDAIDVLHKIGYTDDAELMSDLTGPQPSMAKVFYHMLTAKVAIDELVWTRAVGGASFGQNAEEPFMVGPAMTAFTVNESDPFHRRTSPSLGGSVEAGMSLTMRPEWAPPESEPMVVMQTFDIEAHLTIVQTMLAVQCAVSNLEMQWFHPDDFMIIARRESLGMYVVFQCMNSPGDEVTKMQIQLCHGTCESFTVVCQRTEEIIMLMQSSIGGAPAPM